MSFPALMSRVALGATLAVAALAAQADTYRFELSGSYSATWELDAQPVPDEYFGGVGFVMDNVSGSFSGVSGLVDVGFFQSSMGGGLSIYDIDGDNYMMVSDGPQLYSGTETAPVFKLGSFTMTPYQGSNDSYTLTITDVTAVPEPASIALLMAGLGVVGIAGGRRRTRGQA